MTIRQVFYRLVSLGAVAKTESQYNSTVGRLLREMRWAGEIPFSWIADHTRWMRKPQSYGSLGEALQDTARLYRRALWSGQRVEVWLEKDALAGVLYDVTSEYDVPLMVTRGYPSLTFLHSAAEAIVEQDEPTFLYYFGDHDPSGVDIPRKVESTIRELAPKAEIQFRVAAVTPEQIRLWDLPTRPTKKSDTRSKSFEGGSVEVDAIPPQQLRDLCRQLVEQHVDQGDLEITLAAEESEREILSQLADYDWSEATP